MLVPNAGAVSPSGAVVSRVSLLGDAAVPTVPTARGARSAVLSRSARGALASLSATLVSTLALPALKLRVRRGAGSRLGRKAEESSTETEPELSEAKEDKEAEEAEGERGVEADEESTAIGKAKPRQRRMPFDPTKEPGAMAPLGFFDPLGFCPSGDEGKFKQLRAAELKHGRVAMLASVGLVAQCYIRLPFLGLKDSPAGYKAALLVPSLWMFGLVVIGSMLVEWLFWKEDPWKEPGNFGDPLGLNMYDRDMREKELNNGRFAMFATSGILAAELLTGKTAAEQLGLS